MSEELLNTIRVASVKLDVDNDDHWTNDGLPGLEAIHHFTGNQRIKRSDVTNALPDFNRDAARAAREETVTAPPQAGDAPEAAAPAGDGLVDVNGFVIPQEHSDKEKALSQDDIDARLGELANERNAVAQAAAESAKKTKHIDEEEARLISLRNQLYPPKSFSELIEEHLQATLAREAQKVAKTEEVRKVLVEAGVLREGEKLKTEPNA